MKNTRRNFYETMRIIATLVWYNRSSDGWVLFINFGWHWRTRYAFMYDRTTRQLTDGFFRS